ncbi:nitroreductase [Fructobacillus parabroussonetiae]|uniref:Nitroreductase n=1 Tax=Fructobacillus parabroussonetiae TaxID=2713174 RepID=A0ABS5QWB3_9LACO|nr:nitroreductase [Fructobacillus parabroussonetiae]MBS9337498.1 nitroreductase [Fructobacillus parabroussonetiae]MCK8617028.1 nitroreductase [Fructobacillus parabroussonetiae]
MDFDKVLKSRHSVRQFSDKKIDEMTLFDLIESAQSSPSWVNAQEVGAVVAIGDRLEQMRIKHAELNADDKVKSQPIIPYRPIHEWPEPAQSNMKEWFQSVTDALGDQGSEKLGQTGNQLYQAQAVVYLTLPKDSSNWSLVDLGIFAQTLMLAATNKGIGSIPAYQYVQYPEQLGEALELPIDRVPILGIGLGYFDDKEPLNQIRSKRMKKEDMLTIKD